MIFTVLGLIALTGVIITNRATNPPAANIGMLLFVIGLVGMLIDAVISAIA